MNDKPDSLTIHDTVSAALQQMRGAFELEREALNRRIFELETHLEVQRSLTVEARADAKNWYGLGIRMITEFNNAEMLLGNIKELGVQYAKEIEDGKHKGQSAPSDAAPSGGEAVEGPPPPPGAVS